jgi:hypothetical protein
MELTAQVEHPVRVAVTDDLRRSADCLLPLVARRPALHLALPVEHRGVLRRRGRLARGARDGPVPPGLHEFLARFVRYTTHVNAYAYLAAKPFPSFAGDPGYPLDVEIDGPVPQSRLTVGFRWILAIPAWLLAGVLGVVLAVVAFLGWFFALATGRMHEGMRNLEVYCLRYNAQTSACSYLLTERYPKL